MEDEGIQFLEIKVGGRGDILVNKHWTVMRAWVEILKTHVKARHDGAHM